MLVYIGDRRLDMGVFNFIGGLIYEIKFSMWVFWVLGCFRGFDVGGGLSCWLCCYFFEWLVIDAGF